MIRTLMELLRQPIATNREMFPDLPEYNRGLPRLSGRQCQAGCSACVDACPSEAIDLSDESSNLTLDLGKCIACGDCMSVCPTGTIERDGRTTVAVRTREDLVLTNQPASTEEQTTGKSGPFRRSMHIREVSTGDNASDLEIAAANNPIFDSTRFGIHFVASPRFADALIVTGPVGKAMQEPLRRCYEAMAEPRIVIAAGAPAISGALHRDGYAGADGVDSILPVSVYIPGFPPHPWYILHGILLAMGKETD